MPPALTAHNDLQEPTPCATGTYCNDDVQEPTPCAPWHLLHMTTGVPLAAPLFPTLVANSLHRLSPRSWTHPLN